MKRGDFWIVNLDLTIDSEIKNYEGGLRLVAAAQMHDPSGSFRQKPQVMHAPEVDLLRPIAEIAAQMS